MVGLAVWSNSRESDRQTDLGPEKSAFLRARNLGCKPELQKLLCEGMNTALEHSDSVLDLCKNWIIVVLTIKLSFCPPYLQDFESNNNNKAIIIIMVILISRLRFTKAIHHP